MFGRYRCSCYQYKHGYRGNLVVKNEKDDSATNTLLGHQTNQQSDDPKPLTSAKPSLEKCGKGKYLVGPLYVNQKETTWQTVKEEVGIVNIGGAWSPNDCIAEYKLALIIPFRDRDEHLKIFLRHIHPILQRQRLTYQIFVVEQKDKSMFNRGKLMNVGFNESLKFADFDCFVFHDIDLLPENDKNFYGCNQSPAHLSVAVDKFNYKLLYGTLFGGIEKFTKIDFEKINGFSNLFWGWGAEDDNLYQRVTGSGLGLKRPAIELARYQMIRHAEAPKTDKRFKVLRDAIGFADKDGLSSLNYRVVDKLEHPYYTLLQVDLEESINGCLQHVSDLSPNSVDEREANGAGCCEASFLMLRSMACFISRFHQTWRSNVPEDGTVFRTRGDSVPSKMRRTVFRTRSDSAPKKMRQSSEQGATVRHSSERGATAFRIKCDGVPNKIRQCSEQDATEFQTR
eukprot:gene13974-15431_t